MLRSDEYVQEEAKKDSQLAPKPLWKALKENEEKKRLEESERLRTVNFELDEDGKYALSIANTFLTLTSEKQFLQEYHEKKQQEERMIEAQLQEFRKSQSSKTAQPPQTPSDRVDLKLLKKPEIVKELNFKPSVRFKRKENDHTDSTVPKRPKPEEKQNIPLVSYDFESDED